MAAAGKPETTKLLGLFNDKNIDGVLDRKFLKKGTVDKFPDQPDLTEETRAALDVLSRSDKGFLLMVESGRIDKYSHSLDWERAVYDTIMFDNVVQMAKDFAAKNNDTLVIVVPDHGHPVAIIGTYDDSKGEQLRDRLQTYADAGFPNYPAPRRRGLSRESRRAAPSGRGFSLPIQTIATPASRISRARTSRRSPPPRHPLQPNRRARCPPWRRRQLQRRPLPRRQIPRSSWRSPTRSIASRGRRAKSANLPFTARSGVHAADDVVLTAIGPGSDILHGRIDNTFVFRAMARALGLGQ